MNMNAFLQMIQNPQATLQRMGIPQEYMTSPQSVTEYLLNNGKVTQAQIQQANSMYQNLFGRAK